jgi:N-carbamoylputrescine amidase
MYALRIALIQLAWSGSKESMKEQYSKLVPQAATEGASLICLPEFSLLPYFPGTRDPNGFQWAEPLYGESEAFFASLAKEQGVTLVSSFFEKTDEGYFDVALIHAPDGSLQGYTRKIHIPSGEGYHENEFFGGGNEYPVFDLGTIKIATPTCYDQWFPELSRIYSLNGAEFIFYPTAIGSEPTDPDIDTAEAWQTVMRGQAIANGVFLGAANRVGVENGVTFYGSSFICDPRGKILVQAGRDTTEVLIAELDPYALNHWRDLFPLLRQRRPEAYSEILRK